MSPSYGLCTPSCCSWALIAVGTSVREIYPQADQLQGLAATTMEDQLCRGLPHRAGFTSIRLWFPLSATLECVACGGGWVVLQCGLDLPLGVLALGPPGRYRKGQLLPVFWPGLPGMSYKVICRRLLHALGLYTGEAKLWTKAVSPSVKPGAT